METTNQKIQRNNNSVTPTYDKSWDEVCKETLTITEFKERCKAEEIDVKENPQKINENTGRPNLFFVCGNTTGKVALSIQEKGAVSRPMVSLMEQPDGSEVWTLHEAGTNNVLFSI